MAELLLQAGHADQDQGDVVAVVAIAQQFQSGGTQSFGLVDDDQPHVVPAVSPPPGLGSGRAGRYEVLLDAHVGAGDGLGQLVLQGPRGGQHAGGVEHDAAPVQGGVDLGVVVGARPPVGQQVVSLLVLCVAARGECLSYAG